MVKKKKSIKCVRTKILCKVYLNTFPMKPASMTCRALEHRVGENRLNGLQADGAGQRQSGGGRAGLSGAMFSTKRSDKKK